MTKRQKGGSHQEDEGKVSEKKHVDLYLKGKKVEREDADILTNDGLMKKKRQRTKLSSSIK